MSVNLAAPYVKRQHSRMDLLMGGLDPGKGRRIAAGSYLDDLAALGKCISLCLICLPKFNAKAYSYVTRATLPRANGTCDGCGSWHDANTLLFPAGQFQED